MQLKRVYCFMYNIVPNECHPLWSSLCSSELNSGLCASCTWLLPFWFSPWIVKIFTNVAVMVPELSFLLKYHRHEHQEGLLTSKKKEIPSRNHIADYTFYRVSLPQSWQVELFLFNFSSGKGWPGSSPWHSLHRPFSPLQRCFPFCSMSAVSLPPGCSRKRNRF